MSHLHPAMQAALDAGRCLPVILLRLDLPAPAGSVGLLLGKGQITWDTVTFRGRDATFGSLAALDSPEDGGGDQAPSMSFVIVPPSSTAAAQLVSPAFQGSRVRLWVAALDVAGGAMLGDPYCLFDGELDRPVIEIDGWRKGNATRELEYECISGFEKLFAANEGQRLADASHQAVWPGETGMASVTGIVQLIIWGPGERPGGAIAGGGASGGGGGGGYGAGGYFGSQTAWWNNVERV